MIMSPAKRTSSRKRASIETAESPDREVAITGGSDGLTWDSSAPTNDAPDGTSRQDGVEERIRCRAYEIYCSRSAGDGSELDDWLLAEREVRSALGLSA
jgi:DUF2934 family protein